MPVLPLMDIVDRAFRERYGVAAFNVVNDLTLEAVVAAAAELSSPVIVQTSVKTVRSIGSKLLFAMWREITAGVDVPVSLHLDHCPDRSVITECLKRGWNSVLFDGSRLPVEENLRQTAEVVIEARHYGAHVEGEIEPITGVEDGIGSDEDTGRESLDVALRFIRATGIDVFAPAIGNAHGMYKQTPHLDMQQRLRHRRGRAGTYRLARWHGHDRCPVRGPHQPGVRQDKYLYGVENDLYAVEPRPP